MRASEPSPSKRSGGLTGDCRRQGVIVGTTTGSTCFLEQTGEEYRSSPPIQIAGQVDRRHVLLVSLRWSDWLLPGHPSQNASS